MPLSWNEIKHRAVIFSKEWKDETSESAEAKSFWDDFFNVFGVSRRRVATFEKPVRKLDDRQGYIDLLWKGIILVEHKSRGRDLDRAYKQAVDYFPGLKEHELPKYVLVSDFQRFRLFDLDEDNTHEFDIDKLVENVHLFGFMAGYEKRTYKEEDPVNIEAAELMGKLHDRLKDVGYIGHELELYLVRLLFCLFADDTGIFERGIFWQYIDLHTKPDGSDLAMHLASIFYTLNKPENERLKNIDENLAQFPFVNGKLFEETLPPAAFDSQMREMLLRACSLDWGSISPAIFGSMFQAVMNPEERRNLGAHYTSEKNIQKVIKPLFLDDLYDEFEKAKGNRNRLNELHKKISSLHFLDPACGCGNFLIISYRELRQLEILILRELYKSGQGFLNVQDIILVDVDQFAGIEYDEFPARIAEVAMWLIDHQMNMKVSEEFGQYFVRLPLSKGAKIIHGNALRIDWAQIIPKTELDFIMGNPPFIGYAYQSVGQKEDMSKLFSKVEGSRVLDYVSGWYYKASEYIQGSTIRVAFVSTNSIAQGEQVGILWNSLIEKFNVKIDFAHRTFKWSNEAKNNAGVHVVIIGFSTMEITDKKIYEYDDIKGEPHAKKVKRINPYLVDGETVFIQKRSQPICEVPSINRGSDATDGGHLLLSEDEKDQLINEEPEAEKWIRPFLMAREFLYGKNRYCLWLKGIDPGELRKLPRVLERVNKVREFRTKSKRSKTKQMAVYPYLFSEDRQPESDYLAIPKVTSEGRQYIPIGFCSSDIICGDKLFYLPNASHYLFGILTSLMHMTWMRYTCGRLESRFSYSNTIVYNNFPFPMEFSEKSKEKVSENAQRVLQTRKKYPNSSLADLYDPIAMPPDLVKAHKDLDRAVDLCYRPQPFRSESSRIEFLFQLYEQYTSPMFKTKKK